MLSKIIVFTLLCNFVAESNSVQNSEDLETLKKIIGSGKFFISRTEDALNKARKVYDEIVKERDESLAYTHHKSLNNIKNATGQAVLTAMRFNTLVKNFQCISMNANQSLTNLDSTYNAFLKQSPLIKNSAFEKIYPQKLMVSRLNDYILDMEKTATEEIVNSDSPNQIQIILEDVQTKVTNIESVTLEIDKMIVDTKFKFFESYVDVVHKSENTIKGMANGGVQKILKCV